MGEVSFRTICGFCHTNCGMIVHLKGDKIHRVEGDPENPVNRGYLCAKGYGVKELVYAGDRLPHPMVRIHPDDAEKTCIEDDAWVTVKSPRGEMRALARVSDDTKPGLVVIDFGWGNPWDKEGGNINKLTSNELLDPQCGGTPNRMFVCEVISKA